MKYSEFLKAVQAKTVSPVLTFLGTEAFLKERAREALVNRYLEPDSRAFHYRSFSGEELKDVSFLEDASTVAMFADTKVLYIKNAGFLEKSLGRIQEFLEKYLDHPSTGTLLIFDIDVWEGRSKLKSILTKKTTVVEFQPLSEREIPSWIQSHLRTLNFQIDPPAVQALVERTGPDLQKLSAELEKLMLLRQSEKRIQLKDVESTVGRSPLSTVWDWTEAMLNQESEKAIQALNDLMEQGIEPLYCLVLLGKQYEKMILTREMVQQKVPQATISQKINKPLYYLPKYLRQISAFSMKDLVKAIEIIALTDRALKTSQAPEAIAMQFMTLQLCNLRAPAAPIFDVPLV